MAFLILLDHTKVFDTFDKFSNTAFSVIRSYLMNRSQRVYLKGSISNSLNVGRGFPQGSILGPLLFRIYVNDLPDILDNCSVHIYADDVQLCRSTRMENINHCIDSINCDLQKVDI